tara:strand:+ start:832 stop:1356 length:525 start_codon:yes stop_codon:yes gene_type:complete
MALINTKKIESYPNAYYFIKHKRLGKVFQKEYGVTIEKWAKDPGDISDKDIFEKMLALGKAHFVFIWDKESKHFVIIETTDAIVPPPSVKSILELHKEIDAIIMLRNRLQQEVSDLDEAITQPGRCQLRLHIASKIVDFDKPKDIVNAASTLLESRQAALELVQIKLMDLAKSK